MRHARTARNGVAALLTVGLGTATAPDLSAQVRDTIPPDSVVTLPELTVPIGRVRVGATPIANAPIPVSTVRARMSSSSDLTRSISLQPGITLGNQTGSPYQSDLRFRGFAVSPVVGLPQSVSVFVDGVRVNEADASQVHLSLVPTAAIERIEIVRGPVGAFGKNALAGAVNIVTARGEGDEFADFELERGSFASTSGTVRYGGTRGSVDRLIVASYRESEGWRQLGTSREMSIFNKLGWRGDRTNAWISYTFESDSIDGPGPIPESWIEGEPLPPDITSPPEDLRRLQYTGGKGDAFRSAMHFLNAQLERELDDGWSLLTTGFTRVVDFKQGNDNITEPDALGLTDIGSVGGTLQLVDRGQENAITIIGTEYVRNRVDINILELPNAAFPNVIPGTTELLQTVEHNFAAFWEHWRELRPGLTALTSARIDHVELPVTDLLDPGDSGENTFVEFTGGAGLSWDLSPAANVFAGYNRGFRAPVILEVSCADPADPCQLPFELGPDPPLDPVVSDTWQAGLRLTGGPVRAEVVGYFANVQDDIFNVVDLETPTRGYFTNLDRTRRLGTEAMIEVVAAPGLTLTGSVGLTRATFESEATLSAPFLDDDDDDPMPPGPPGPPDDDDDLEPPEVEPGDRFPMVPGISGTLSARYDRGSTSFEATLHHTGEQYLVGDESNEAPFEKLAGSAVVDFRVEHQFDRATIYAEVANLFDTEYDLFGIISRNVRGMDEEVERFLTPGLPRSMRIGMRVRPDF